MTFDIRDYINEDWLEEQDYAHTIDIIKNLFDGRLLRCEVKGNYQGEIGAVWEVGPNYVVVSSYFGSCSVCDRGYAANDLQKLAVKIASSGRIFSSKEEVNEYVQDLGNPEDYTMRAAKGLTVE